MKTVVYNGFDGTNFRNGGTNLFAGEVEVVKSGRLRGIYICLSGSGGAANAQMSTAATLNSIGSSQSNNPSRFDILGSVRFAVASSGTFFVNSGFIPLDIAVEPGDRLDATSFLVGTAPATGYLSIAYYVQEA